MDANNKSNSDNPYPTLSIIAALSFCTRLIYMTVYMYTDEIIK